MVQPSASGLDRKGHAEGKILAACRALRRVAPDLFEALAKAKRDPHELVISQYLVGQV
jgi:hypothetical protein